MESSSVFSWKSAHLFHPLLMVASPCALYQPQVSNFHLHPFLSPGPTLMSTLGRLFLQPHLPQPLPLHGQLDYYVSLMLLLDTLKTQGSQAGIAALQHLAWPCLSYVPGSWNGTCFCSCCDTYSWPGVPASLVPPSEQCSYRGDPFTHHTPAFPTEVSAYLPRPLEHHRRSHVSPLPARGFLALRRYSELSV